MNKDELDQTNDENINKDQEDSVEEGISPKSPEQEDYAYKPPNNGGRICITYGRDQIMNKQVVSVIRSLGIDPIVMQDKQNRDKPLAQFVTEYQDISFAIVILSADDWVYPKSGKPKDAFTFTDQKIVFHLGFWTGKLGRSRVFTLYYDQRSFRHPTEHFDVIYTPLDKNDLWKKELVSRLIASNIKITQE